jgi:hypothetical protein
MKLYTIVFTLTAWILGTASTTRADFFFENPTRIDIPFLGVANPYPSVISVSGVTGAIGDFSLSLRNLSHDWPDDLGAVVVSPTGRAVLLFSGPGDATPAGNINLTFNQNAATEINREGALVSGTYRPGMQQWLENFPAPGPGTNFEFSFQPYLNENPNGDWRLFVQDSGQGERGFIANGWSVNFTAVPEPGSIVLLATASIAVFGMRRMRRRHVG